MMDVSEAKIIVSIATIPSRIGSLGPTLDSLMKGRVVPDQILIVHPEYCDWESAPYPEVDFLDDPGAYNGTVVRHVTERDWGPSTKILGALEFTKDDCILILADDDVSYHPSFVEGLVSAQKNDERSSFSYLTYRCFGLPLGQGVDGYSFWTPNLRGMRAFADRNVVGTTLMYHDDLWIGFFLFLHSIKVKRLKVPDGREMVYEQILPNSVLSAVSAGSLSRKAIIRDHVRRLIALPEVTPSQRRFLRLNAFFQSVEDALYFVRRIPSRAMRKASKGFG